MVTNESSCPRPGRNRIEGLDEACADHRASAVTAPARPAKLVKLRDEPRYFRRVKDSGDCRRRGCYRGNCQASHNLVWSRPRKFALRGGSFCVFAGRSLSGRSDGKTLPPSMAAHPCGLHGTRTFAPFLRRPACLLNRKGHLTVALRLTGAEWYSRLVFKTAP